VLFSLLATGVSAKEVSDDHHNDAKTWTVLVGGQTELAPSAIGLAGIWQFMKFYPDNITIDEGDTINFKYNSAEIHNVYFPGSDNQFAPFTIGPFFNPDVVYPLGNEVYDGSSPAGSGIFRLDPSTPNVFKLKFTKAGTYSYICSIHGGVDSNNNPVGMVGKVTVNPKGTPYPKSQEQVQDLVEKLLKHDSQIAHQNDAAARKVTKSAGPNGSTIYTMNVGYIAQQDEMIEFMRFGSDNLKIKEGDTVVWIPQSAPHTVSFANSGTLPPDIIPAVFNGKNTFALNFAGLGPLPPGGTTVFDATQPISSGLLQGPYSLTFNEAGQFSYICVFHDDMGMVAKITVKHKGDDNRNDN
jgi:plastocyanin